MSFFKNIFNRANKNLTEEEFSIVYFKTLKKKLPKARLISYNNLELELDLGNEIQMKSFLNNAYLEYNNAPNEIEEILNRYSDALIHFNEENNAEIDPKNIIPVIKNINFIHSNLELNPNFEKDGLYEKINDELYLFFVSNLPNSLKYIYKSEFENLDISMIDLKNIALNNLENIEESPQRQGEKGFYGLLLDGNFEASLILLDIWNKENFEVKGEIIVAIPARDVLLITGSEDQENLIKIKETTADIFNNGDHIISEKLFIYQNGKFEVFN